MCNKNIFIQKSYICYYIFITIYILKIKRYYDLNTIYSILYHNKTIILKTIVK